MLEAADARRGVVELARLFLRRSNRQSRVNHQHVRSGGEDRYRRERFDGIVFERVKRRVYSMRDRYHAQSVAIRRGAGTGLRANSAPGTRAVVDINLLPQLYAELLCDQTADH